MATLCRRGWPRLKARYSAPLLRAIEWALSIKAELRPHTIAEWKAAFDAQVQDAAMPRATVATPLIAAPSAAIPSRTAPERPLPERSDPRAGWRHLGLGILLILALLAGLDWHKRNPLEVNKPQPAPPPAGIKEPAGDDASSVNSPVMAPAPASSAEEANTPRLPDPQTVKAFAPGIESRERLPRPEPAIPIPDRARERVSEEFRGADRNGDGYLSATEVEGRFPGVSRDFQAIDRDGDRRLSLDEFITYRRLQFESRRVQPAPKP